MRLVLGESVLLAPLVAVLFGMPHPAMMLRCFERVFDLATQNGKVYVATDGGAVVLSNQGGWNAEDSHPALRSIAQTNPAVYVQDGGRMFVENGDQLVPFHGTVNPRPRDLEHGLFVPKDWRRRNEFTSVREQLESLPPVQINVVMRTEELLYAGTLDGLYVSSGSGWKRVELYSRIANCDPTGCALIDSDIIVASRQGLFKIGGNGWRQLSTAAVGSIRRIQGNGWALRSDGGVDEIPAGQKTVRADVLEHGKGNPATTCIGFSGTTVLFGRQGGWLEWGKNRIAMAPSQLRGKEITGIAGHDGIRWIGTRDSGLWEFGKGRPKVWNTSTGLPDNNVVDLAQTRQGLVVATARHGVYLLKGKELKSLACPASSVMSVFNNFGYLLVCSPQGVWEAYVGEWTWSQVYSGEDMPTGVGDANSDVFVTCRHGIYIQGWSAYSPLRVRSRLSMSARSCARPAALLSSMRSSMLGKNTSCSPNLPGTRL